MHTSASSDIGLHHGMHQVSGAADVHNHDLGLMRLSVLQALSASTDASC